jgi:hypothetical protein
MGIGFFLVVTGLVADLVGVNRKLLEGVDHRLRQLWERKVDADPAFRVEGRRSG